MKSFTTVAALAALASTSYAGTVTLEETSCISSNAELQTFTIETDQLVVKALDSVCGLKIKEVSEGVDINTISCQAFKDAEGTQPGSAKFTFATPALISTNPVQEAALRCDTNGDSPKTTLESRQAAGTGGAPASTGGLPTPSGNSTVPSATQTPTQSAPSDTGAPQPTGAASTIGYSVGSLALAFAAFFVL